MDQIVTFYNSLLIFCTLENKEQSMNLSPLYIYKPPIMASSTYFYHCTSYFTVKLMPLLAFFKAASTLLSSSLLRLLAEIILMFSSLFNIL